MTPGLLSNPTLMQQAAPQQQQTAPSNQIPYWGFYGSGMPLDFDPSSTQPGQEFLTGIRQYNPNASFKQVQMGESGSPYYVLDMGSGAKYGESFFNKNIDLNPGDFAPQHLSPQDITNEGGFDHAKQVVPGNFQGQLIHPNLTWNNPVLGHVTDPRNVRQQRDWLSMVGPAIPMLLAGIMSGGATMPLLARLGMGGVNLARSLGSGMHFNPYSLMGAGLGFVPGMNPFLARLGSFGLNTLGSQRRGG